MLESHDYRLKSMTARGYQGDGAERGFRIERLNTKYLLRSCTPGGSTRTNWCHNANPPFVGNLLTTIERLLAPASGDARLIRSISYIHVAFLILKRQSEPEEVSKLAKSGTLTSIRKHRLVESGFPE